MKRLIWLFIFFLPFFLVAQDYSERANTQRWKEVERLIRIKNYEQILPILADIKAAARKNDNKAEWVRAVLAESRTMGINNTSDTAFVKTKRHFERSIRQSNVVEKAVLQNFYAIFLWANANRYLSKSMDNFIMANAKAKYRIIDSVFALSLIDEASLLDNPIHRWSPIFAEATNLTLSPTLYHFLGYQYMDFLKKVSNNRTAGRYGQLKDRLLAINEENGYTDATAYILSLDIDALYGSEEFVLGYENVIRQHKSDYNAFLLYRIAQQYNHGHGDKAKAMEYIRRALDEYPRSPWISNVQGMEKEIRQAGLDIEHQLFVPSDEYIPIKLRAQNVDTLYLRVYNTTNTPKNYRQYRVRYDSTSFRTSMDATVQYEDHKSLKQFGDYNMHQTIYKLAPLPYGSYTILASNNREFRNDGEQRTVVSSDVIVTDLFITATMDKETDDFDQYSGLLINRKTGMPYAGKKVSLYDTDLNTPKLIRSMRTDQKGEFVYKTNDRKANLDIDECVLFVAEENQLIALDELDDIPEHLKEEDDEDEGNTQFSILSDRAIYRPGQTVYFKTIMYNDRELTGTVIEGKEIDIALYDANHQKVDSLTMVTNAFGSVHGSFRLPGKTLAGTFRLKFASKGAGSAAHDIRVEEYKRPTFKVEFEANKETYTLKDTAIFVGKVESLSGATLSDASVRYTVEFYSTKERTTITYLDTVTATDAEGNFRIVVPLMNTVFRGLTDFRLNFTAEVTNQSGEMQSTSDSYAFSTRPWRLAVEIPHYAEEGRWGSLHIRTTNQNGQPLKFARYSPYL